MVPIVRQRPLAFTGSICYPVAVSMPRLQGTRIVLSCPVSVSHPMRPHPSPVFANKNYPTDLSYGPQSTSALTTAPSFRPVTYHRRPTDIDCAAMRSYD